MHREVGMYLARSVARGGGVTKAFAPGTCGIVV